MKYIIKLSTVILTIFLCINAFADEIHLRDGTIIKGKIKRMTDKNIEYYPEGDKKLDIVVKSDAEKIIYSNGVVFNMTQKMGDGSNDSKRTLNLQYPVIGATVSAVGVPGYVNLLAGYYFQHIGFHASGIYIGNSIYGAQLNLLYKFFEMKNFVHSFSFIGGLSHLDFQGHYRNLKFGGAAINFNFYGFFIECGITYSNGVIGDKSISDPFFILQLGYVIKFM